MIRHKLFRSSICLLVMDAVFFDMDGVVVDSESHWVKYETERVFPEAVEEPVAIEEIVGMNVEDLYEHLTREYTISIERSAFLDLYDEVAREVYTAADPMPKFAEVVGSIQQPVGLVTSSPERWIDIVFERWNLYDTFDVVVSADEVDHGKPAPDVYLRAASLLNVAPTDCLAIEDSTNGVRSAAQADMTVIAYGDPSDEAVTTADTTARTSDELRTTLQEQTT
jgi:HAD superfamily hydrolase (TIGR01509 family)